MGKVVLFNVFYNIQLFIISLYYILKIGAYVKYFINSPYL